MEIKERYIEQQKVRQQFFEDRSLFYSTFAIQEQALKGQDWDFRLNEVYLLKNLHKFRDIPTILQERVFRKVV